MPFFLSLCGRVKTELFENTDVTGSIYYTSEDALVSLGISQGHFAYQFSSIEAGMSNIVIEYRISLSNIEFEMSQRFHVDGDILENAPRVDVDLLSDR